MQLCDNQLASGRLPTLRGHKPQVIVKIDAEDLFGAEAGPGADVLVRRAPLARLDRRRRDQLDNFALLCERHHTEVHHGFRVERRPDGRWRTWRPDGNEIRTGPSHLETAA